MKIKEIWVGDIRIPLIRPFVTAVRRVSTVESKIVKIITDTGHVGYGEGPCTGPITGDTKESIAQAILCHIKPAILGMEIRNLEDIMYQIHHCLVGNPSAKACVDMAIYDLYGQLHGAPLYQLLGGHRQSLVTDMTISVGETQTMITESLKAIEKGFTTLKLKVGTEGLADIQKVMAIKKAINNPTIKLCVDANQGWQTKEAIRIIKTLEDRGADLELVEQPVIASDMKGMAQITQQTLTLIVADEGVASPRQALAFFEAGAADMVNIKLMKAGGIYNALKICAIAETYGKSCMIGSMLESHLSVSAAAHLACGKRVIKKIDLDTPLMGKTASVQGHVKYEDSRLLMTGGTGLGVEGLNTNVVEI